MVSLIGRHLPFTRPSSSLCFSSAPSILLHHKPSLPITRNYHQNIKQSPALPRTAFRLHIHNLSSHHSHTWTKDNEVNEDEAAAAALACGRAEIHLIVGPMFAGKTTALLNRMLVEQEAGRRVALLKSDKDTRYGLAAVVSHDGIQMPCWAVPTLAVFRERIGQELYNQIDVIGIDEAQFFKDLYAFCQVAADDEGKTIVVAGLDGDFLRKSFGSILELVPIADSIVKLSSRCEICGRPASFTFRKIDNTNREVIGGADVYMPVCRQHYATGTIVKNIARRVVKDADGIESVIESSTTC